MCGSLDRLLQGFMQQVKALPLPETKQEREARLSTALGVAGSSSGPGGVPAAVIPAPMEDDEDLHHGDDAMHDFDLGEEDGNLPVRPHKRHNHARVTMLGLSLPAQPCRFLLSIALSMRRHSLTLGLHS